MEVVAVPEIVGDGGAVPDVPGIWLAACALAASLPDAPKPPTAPLPRERCWDCGGDGRTARPGAGQTQETQLEGLAS
jgi:hypothetical protein